MTKSGSYLGRVRDVFVTRWSFESLIELSSSRIMDLPLPMPQLDVDVDLGFALFFLALLCLFLLATMVRCAQMVLDPYSTISAFTYQEEELEGWRLKQADWEPLDSRRTLKQMLLETHLHFLCGDLDFIGTNLRKGIWVSLWDLITTSNHHWVHINQQSCVFELKYYARMH